MKRFSPFLQAILILALLLTNAPKLAAIERPIEEIKRTLDELVVSVQKYPGDQNKQARRADLRAIINPRFDFNEMSKSCLGRHWLSATPDERVEFITLFSDLLARTYLSHVEKIRPGMVEVQNENVDAEGQKATVKTEVTDKGDKFSIDYRLINQEGKWRVFDVKVEGISLVVNYRNEFSGIIRKDKMGGLIAKLKAKQAN